MTLAGNSWHFETWHFETWWHNKSLKSKNYLHLQSSEESLEKSEKIVQSTKDSIFGEQLLPCSLNRQREVVVTGIHGGMYGELYEVSEHI